MARLTLIRGVPGSGKSTLAKRLVGHGNYICMVEADTYRFNDEGEYVFDPSRSHECHNKCLQQAKEYLSDGWDVVVSNTFIKVEHMKPYLNLVKPHEIAIYECWSIRDNVHGVPDETVKRMIREFEPYIHDATEG